MLASRSNLAGYFESLRGKEKLKRWLAKKQRSNVKRQSGKYFSLSSDPRSDYFRKLANWLAIVYNVKLYRQTEKKRINGSGQIKKKQAGCGVLGACEWSIYE